MANAADIQNLYIAYFNRPADVAGLTYWTSGAQASFSLVQIAQLFSQQTEYASAFANFATAQTVNALYKNLFNHEADPSGLNYWVGQINNGTFTIGQVAIAILSGATGTDAATVAAKFAAASAFTAKMVAKPSAQTVYSPANSNAFGVAKAWLAGVVDNASSSSAINALDNAFAAMANPAVVLHPSGSVTVVPGVANYGDIFNATEAALSTPGTVIHGNGGAELNVTSPFTDAAHPAVVTGVSTLNLQQGGVVLDADTKFINQFTTINDYGAKDGDFLYMGTVAQTVNLYSLIGRRQIKLNAPNQVIKQVVEKYANVGIYTTNANLVGASFDLTKAKGGAGNSIYITDDGTADLSSASLANVGNIYIDGSENLKISPAGDIRVAFTFQERSLTSSLACSTNSNVTVWQGNKQTLNLAGAANYIVRPDVSGVIIDTATSGTLKVLGSYSGYPDIISSVTTTIETTDNCTDFLGGTGSFTVTNLGQFYKTFICESSRAPLEGSVTVNTVGTYDAAFYEGSGTGSVTVNLGGTGKLDLRTHPNHTTIVNAVAGVNGYLYLTGGGNVTVNAAASGNLLVGGYASLETINLPLNGSGADAIEVDFSTLGHLSDTLITINNFKASGTEVLHTGKKAMSMGAININVTDFGSLASNIASHVGALKWGDAFIVNVAGGAAAGTYVYEHVTGTTVNAGDVIVKLTGTTGSVVAGDLQA